MVKNLPAKQETWVLSLGWEDPLEKGPATHSSILAWRIPWAVYSPWGRKQSDTTERLSLSLWTVGFMSNASVLKQPSSFCSILAILNLGQMFQAHLVHILPQTLNQLFL